MLNVLFCYKMYVISGLWFLLKPNTQKKKKIRIVVVDFLLLSPATSLEILIKRVKDLCW